MSTHNMCFLAEIRKILLGYPLLSGTVVRASLFKYLRVNMVIDCCHFMPSF